MGRGLFPRLNVSLRRRRPSAPPMEPGRPGGLGARSDGAFPLAAGKALRKRTTGRDGWRWRRRRRVGLFCGSPPAGEAAVAAQPAGARQRGFRGQNGAGESGLRRARSACSCVILLVPSLVCAGVPLTRVGGVVFCQGARRCLRPSAALSAAPRRARAGRSTTTGRGAWARRAPATAAAAADGNAYLFGDV